MNWWENGTLCRVLLGKLEGKRQLGIPVSRWKDNIKKSLKALKHRIRTIEGLL